MIFDVVCGVVIGGIILWLLAVFAEPLIKLVMIVAGVIAVGAILWFLIEFCVGAWEVATRTGIRTDIPYRVFTMTTGLGLFVVFLTIWSEFMDGFPKSRWLAETLEKRRAKAAKASPTPNPVSAAPPNPKLAPWEIEQKERSVRRAQLRKLYADRFTSSDPQ